MLASRLHAYEHLSVDFLFLPEILQCLFLYNLIAGSMDDAICLLYTGEKVV
jgi:hypothetical protein